MKLISSILNDYRLLPYFLEHYEKQGVNHFYFFVYDMNFNLEIKNCTFLKSVLSQNDFSGHMDCDIHNFMRKIFIQPEEWYVVADLDEFSILDNCTIKEATEICDAFGSNVILGELCDRVTIDGSIPPELDVDIWKQFPNIMPVTKEIRLAPTRKLVAAKGDIEIGDGHHDAIGDINAFSIKAKVNHFSWWGDVVERFKKRCESKASDKPNYKNIIKYLEENKKIS